MNYQETQDYLDSLNRLGSVPGLDSIRELLYRLGNPQNKTKFIHISGTNGKGSANAFISEILKTAGYRTGRYISPAVLSPLEIIQMNNENISEEEFSDIVSEIAVKCDEIVNDGLNHPTRFEIETAAAFVFFNRNKCDFAVVECGMGGLLDATNVINTTVCSIIMPISVDHTSFLGDTLEEIVSHKAGIIKPNTPVICAKQQSQKAYDIILETARINNSECVIVNTDIMNVNYGESISFDYKELTDIHISLKGIYQPYNAIPAIECAFMLRKYGYQIKNSDIYTGLLNASWFGRFTVLGNSPDFIVDGSHNPHGAQMLSECLGTYYPQGGLTFIIGIFKDKDYKKILEYCMPYAKNVFVIETPENIRSMPVKTLAEFIKNNYDVCVYTYETIELSVKKALEITAKDNAVIAFGSLSHLGIIKKAYEVTL